MNRKWIQHSFKYKTQRIAMKRKDAIVENQGVFSCIANAIRKEFTVKITVIVKIV